MRTPCSREKCRSPRDGLCSAQPASTTLEPLKSNNDASLRVRRAQAQTRPPYLVNNSRANRASKEICADAKFKRCEIWPALRPPTAGGVNTGCRGHPCPPVAIYLTVPEIGIDTAPVFAP